MHRLDRLLLLALVLVVAGCGGGRAITGSFVLTDDDVAWTSTSCEGTGGYSDIRAGTDVVVKDATGTIIGTAALVPDPERSGTTRCTYTFMVPVKDAEFYAVSVGKRGELTYSKAEMEAQGWTVGFTLGS